MPSPNWGISPWPGSRTQMPPHGPSEGQFSSEQQAWAKSFLLPGPGRIGGGGGGYWGLNPGASFE